jgi:hypothetical protein
MRGSAFAYEFLAFEGICLTRISVRDLVGYPGAELH